MKEDNDTKAILVFVATAYALSIMLSLVVGLTGGHESAFIGLAYLSMFLPAVSVLIVSSAMHEAPRLRWDHFPLRYLPIALFLIPSVEHAVMLPLMAAAPGGVQWQDWLTPQADGLYHTPSSRGWGALAIQGAWDTLCSMRLSGWQPIPLWRFSRKSVGERGCSPGSGIGLALAVR